MMNGNLFRRADKGAALVETAVLLPLLLLLLVGLVDIGRLLYTRTPLQEAAQEGANFASFDSDSYADVRTRVVEAIDSPAIVTTNITVECLDDAPGDGTLDRVEISVAHNVNLINPLMYPFFGGGTVTLTASATGDLFVDPDNCESSP